MRICIFTADLATIDARHEAIVRQIRTRTGVDVITETFAVGLRQTGPIAAGIEVGRPYVVAERYTQTRFANAMLRLVDAKLAPPATARGALALCGDELVEAILACDPDVVWLDVTWGRILRTRLQREFPGIVCLCVNDRPAQRVATIEAATASAKVSIVLPTHNGVKYLRQSIASCLDQTHRNLELIVVDDGSAQDIGAVVAEFRDPRLRFIRHDVNRGLPATLNTGFAHTTGAFLTWTSDDNYYAPDAIERLTRFLLRHPHVSFVYASLYIIDESLGPRPVRIQHVLPPANLKKQNSLGACFLYTRKVYETIGDYNRSAVLVEDYDYWIRVSKRFRMQRIHAPLYYYRYHDQSLTAKHSREDVAQRFDVVRQQNGLA